MVFSKMLILEVGFDEVINTSELALASVHIPLEGAHLVLRDIDAESRQYLVERRSFTPR